MKEVYELRIRNEYAHLIEVAPDVRKEAYHITALKIEGKDPKLKKIETIYRSLCKKDEYLFHGWIIDRQYIPQELEQARIFQLKITSVFQPEGEERGTKYDDVAACPKCGAGAPQLTPLYLPEKRIPKSKDISRTIAGEIVVSLRVKELFARHKITGGQLTPLRYSPKSSAESTDWFQLTLTDTKVEVASKSWVGLGLFQEDSKGEYRCPRGDTIGLNLVSELFVKTFDIKSDVMGTHQFFGARQGVLRPERKILISPRLYKLMEAENIKGYKVEVAHMV